MTHTFTAPQGMYGVMSGAKVRINPETCKHLGRFIFEEGGGFGFTVYSLRFTDDYMKSRMQVALVLRWCGGAGVRGYEI